MSVCFVCSVFTIQSASVALWFDLIWFDLIWFELNCTPKQMMQTIISRWQRQNSQRLEVEWQETTTTTIVIWKYNWVSGERERERGGGRQRPNKGKSKEIASSGSNHFLVTLQIKPIGRTFESPRERMCVRETDRCGKNGDRTALQTKTNGNFSPSTIATTTTTAAASYPVNQPSIESSGVKIVVSIALCSNDICPYARIDWFSSPFPSAAPLPLSLLCSLYHFPIKINFQLKSEQLFCGAQSQGFLSDRKSCLFDLQKTLHHINFSSRVESSTFVNERCVCASLN